MKQTEKGKNQIDYWCFQWRKTDLVSQNNGLGTARDYGMVDQ